MAEFELGTRSPREAYHLLTRLVAPRPIAWVSTLRADGAGNLAPFSFYMLGGANPPSCVICPVSDRHGMPKDTLRNLEASGEYVINVATRALAERVNQSSYPYEYGDDEFDRAGLTRAPSAVVAPPRVAESPAALECAVHQIVHHGEGPLASHYVIGEVRHVYVDDAVLRDGLPDDRAIEFIGRLGAAFYTHVSSASLFEMQRPEEP